MAEWSVHGAGGLGVPSLNPPTPADFLDVAEWVKNTHML